MSVNGSARRWWRHGRLLATSIVLAVICSACAGIFQNVGTSDCSLKPVGASGSPDRRIGPARVAVLCATQVEVDGRVYDVGVGRWLNEDALELSEYAPITRANDVVIEPIAYALDGVDPEAFLVMRGNDTDDLGAMGPFMALWGEAGPSVPRSLCRYADEADPQYPAECAGTDR